MVPTSSFLLISTCLALLICVSLPLPVLATDEPGALIERELGRDMESFLGADNGAPYTRIETANPLEPNSRPGRLHLPVTSGPCWTQPQVRLNISCA